MPTYKGDFACAGFASGEALVMALPRPADGLGPTVSARDPASSSMAALLRGGQQEEGGQQPRVVHRIVAHTGRVSKCLDPCVSV